MMRQKKNYMHAGAARRAESARVFTIINQCKTVIWPAVTPGESFGGGGFALRPGQSMMFTAPVGWSGRIWGRTDCNFDAGGNGSCATGSCGSALKCGSSGATPASLAEFTLASVDYYDVSLVDGFNLPMVITPVNRQGNCSAAGCDGDLRLSCPSELAVKANGRTVACRSACDVFNTDQYCCRGLFGNPATCQPTFYSKKFKAACPTAYSYAYDDPTSIFTCSDADYVITFCSNRYRYSYIIGSILLAANQSPSPCQLNLCMCSAACNACMLFSSEHAVLLNLVLAPTSEIANAPSLHCQGI